MLKVIETIDFLIDYSIKRGADVNSIILDRGTLIDFQYDLKQYYNDAFGEIKNMEVYRGCKIILYPGTNKVHLEIK